MNIDKSSIDWIGNVRTRVPLKMASIKRIKMKGGVFRTRLTIHKRALMQTSMKDGDKVDVGIKENDSGLTIIVSPNPHGAFTLSKRSVKTDEKAVITSCVTINPPLDIEDFSFTSDHMQPVVIVDDEDSEGAFPGVAFTIPNKTSTETKA